MKYTDIAEHVKQYEEAKATYNALSLLTPGVGAEVTDVVFNATDCKGRAVAVKLETANGLVHAARYMVDDAIEVLGGKLERLRGELRCMGFEFDDNEPGAVFDFDPERDQ